VADLFSTDLLCLLTRYVFASLYVHSVIYIRSYLRFFVYDCGCSSMLTIVFYRICKLTCFWQVERASWEVVLTANLENFEDSVLRQNIQTHSKSFALCLFKVRVPLAL
jgi:hypothetical protein